ncbi:MAG: hypothetical protein U0M02_07795 [Acutalibacteraceae bacterium]|nr:hypothetical protein [Acutalibacteraceae bacterium]
MDFFRQWAVSLIISAAAVTVVIILTPRGSTDKTVKAVASIFVISVIFAPFAHTEIDFPTLEAAADYGDEIYSDLNDSMLEACRNAVENALTRKAAEMRAVLEDICINVNIDADGCIIIHGISVTVSSCDGCDLQELSSALGEAAGVPVTVLKNE